MSCVELKQQQAYKQARNIHAPFGAKIAQKAHEYCVIMH
jgi:hypothetical protein